MKIIIPAILCFIIFPNCKTINNINYIHDDVKISFTIQKSSTDSIHWDESWGKVYLGDEYLGFVTKESVLNVHMNDTIVKHIDTVSSYITYCNVELLPVTGKEDGIFKIYNLKDSNNEIFVLKSNNNSMYFEVKKN